MGASRLDNELSIKAQKMKENHWVEIVSHAVGIYTCVLRRPHHLETEKKTAEVDWRRGPTMRDILRDIGEGDGLYAGLGGLAR